MVKTGFTLLEILIVLVILSVLFGIGYVSFETVYRNISTESRLSGISQNLFFFLVEARRGAVLKDTIYCIKFNGGKFYSFVDEDLDGNSDNGKKSEISLEESMEVYVNGNKVENFEIYTYDAFFFEKEWKYVDNGVF